MHVDLLRVAALSAAEMDVRDVHDTVESFMRIAGGQNATQPSELRGKTAIAAADAGCGGLGSDGRGFAGAKGQVSEDGVSKLESEVSESKKAFG